MKLLRVIQPSSHEGVWILQPIYLGSFFRILSIFHFVGTNVFDATCQEYQIKFLNVHTLDLVDPTALMLRLRLLHYAQRHLE